MRSASGNKLIAKDQAAGCDEQREVPPVSWCGTYPLSHSNQMLQRCVQWVPLAVQAAGDQLLPLTHIECLDVIFSMRHNLFISYSSQILQRCLMWVLPAVQAAGDPAAACDHHLL